MKKLTLLSAIFLTSVMMFGQTSQVTVSTEKSGEIVAPSPAMQTLILAGRLAKFGYENNSVTSLIQAAELYKTVSLQEFKPISFEQGKSTIEEIAKEEYISFDADKILSDAKALADGDKVYLAMIDKVENMRTRGAVGGPKTSISKIAANSKNQYVVKFEANKPAVVAVSGDGDTDLDLYIYDENENLITKDDDYSDDCIVSWNPRWTGNFIIIVVNRGNTWNKYEIATN